VVSLRLDTLTISAADCWLLRTILPRGRAGPLWRRSVDNPGSLDDSARLAVPVDTVGRALVVPIPAAQHAERRTGAAVACEVGESGL
jgi:hypothetical protein